MNGLDKFKPMKFFIFLKVFLITFYVQASEFPISPKITYGKLDNGLTYYIRPNPKPKAKAEIRLIVTAGSAHEREDQKGLAHLLEHMAFNGSKDFPKRSIDEYFNSIGLSLGADFNAYTSFDRTVYKFSVPTDDGKSLKTGIHILSDIAGFLKLEPEAFERERKIVEEEWRGDLGLEDRLFKKQVKYLYKNSIFEKRLPIGDINIIRTFPYKAVIDYYQKYYRPGLMAVIVVGDIKVGEVKEYINQFFSRIEKPKNKITLPNLDVPDYNQTIYAVTTDPEQEQTYFSIASKHKSLIVKDKASYREFLINKLASTLFQKRLDTFDNVYFYSSSISQARLAQNSDLYEISVSLNENTIEPGLDFLMMELERVRLHGFLQTEIEIIKKEMLTDYLKSLRLEGTKSSSRYIGELRRHFMEGEMISGIEYEYQLVKEILPTITKQEIDQAFLKYLSTTNRIVEFVTNDKNKNKIPSEQDYVKFENQRSQMDLLPFKLSISEKGLVSKNLETKKITSRMYYPSLKTTELKLENGIRVFLRPSKYLNDQIEFDAKSLGGYSHELDLNKLTSAKFSADIVSESGLAGQERGELNYKYPSRFVAVTPYISPFDEGISGSAFKPYLEDMFQMIYATFNDVYVYDNSFEQFKSGLEQMVQNENLDSSYKFRTTVREKLFQNHPRRKKLSLNDVKSMNLEDVESFFKSRFADASDFTFVFTGDFEMNEMIKLCQIYLGNLPNLNRNESYVDHNIDYANSYQTLEFKDNLENQSTGFRIYSEPFNYNIKNRFIAYITSDILDRLANDTIREELNLVYSVSFNDYFTQKYPIQRIANYVYFNSNPKNAERVFEAFNKIADQVKKGEFKDQFFNDAITKRLVGLEEDQLTNGFWTSGLLNYSFENEPIQALSNLDYIIKGITKRDIINYANKILDQKYLQAVLLPR